MDMNQEEPSIKQDGEEASATVKEDKVEHILEKLEPEEQEVIMTAISYSAPIPPPDILKGYAEIYPDAPEKIFNWVDDQQRHRHEMEKEHLNKSFSHSKIGMIGGIFLSFSFIICAFVLIVLDKEFLGMSLIGGYIVSLVGILVARKGIEKKREDSNNDEGENSATE